VFSFTVDGVHPHDLASVLDEAGVAVRSGHHCAMPLHRKLGLPATTRASCSIYTTKEDIDRLVEGIARAQQLFT
jgi:cysteine desulfurase/selenocysteine lyase